MGLDLVEMVMEVESEFGIEISEADAERLRTVGLLFDYVHARVAPTPGVGVPYAGELWERYLSVLERELGVDRDRLQPTARFVDDLGVD